MATPRTVNWAHLRARYIAEDGLTGRELARQEGIAHTTLAQRSSAENWPALRLERQEQQATETLSEIRRKAVESDVARDAAHKAALRKAIRALEDSIASGTLEANSLDAATNALVNAIKGERLVLGETTERTDQNVTVSGDAYTIISGKLSGIAARRRAGDDPPGAE